MTEHPLSSQSYSGNGYWNVLTPRPLTWANCWFPHIWPWWKAWDIDLIPPR